MATAHAPVGGQVCRRVEYERPCRCGIGLSSLSDFCTGLPPGGPGPGTVGLTAGTDVHLLDGGEQRTTDERGIVGRPEEVAEALSGFAHAGVRHLICSVRPYSPAGIERLGTAVELLRSSISDEAGPMLY